MRRAGEGGRFLYIMLESWGGACALFDWSTEKSGNKASVGCWKFIGQFINEHRYIQWLPYPDNGCHSLCYTYVPCSLWLEHYSYLLQKSLGMRLVGMLGIHSMEFSMEFWSWKNWSNTLLKMVRVTHQKTLSCIVPCSVARKSCTWYIDAAFSLPLYAWRHHLHCLWLWQNMKLLKVVV